MQLAIENIRCMSNETLSSSIIYHHDLELLDTKSNWMSLQAAQQDGSHQVPQSNTLKIKLVQFLWFYSKNIWPSDLTEHYLGTWRRGLIPRSSEGTLQLQGIYWPFHQCPDRSTTILCETTNKGKRLRVSPRRTTACSCATWRTVL